MLSSILSHHSELNHAFNCEQLGPSPTIQIAQMHMGWCLNRGCPQHPFKPDLVPCLNTDVTNTTNISIKYESVSVFIHVSKLNFDREIIQNKMSLDRQVPSQNLIM